MSESKKSWRDVYRIHQAAEIFPRLADDELRELGEDIKRNGLKEPITLWSMKPEEAESHAVILDGRNRLDAMELVGMETVDLIGDKYRLAKAPVYLSLEPNPYLPTCGGINPFSYAISKNIHRRHLSKEQRADLILQALKLEESPNFSSMRRSVVRVEHGQFSGSTKEPLKEKFIAAAAQQGIGKATAQRTWDKDRGPAFERTAPKINTNNIATEREVKNTLSHLEGRFKNLPHSAIKEIITSVVDRFGGDEKSFYRERLDEGFYHDPGSDPLAEFDIKKVTSRILALLEEASQIEVRQVIAAIQRKFLAA